MPLRFSGQMREDQKKQIQEIVALFRKAERLIKRIETLESALSIPSVNELRYVGYHLCCALVGDGCLDPRSAPITDTADSRSEDERIDEQIVSAKRHCKRALYDAYEIGIVHHLESIEAFEEKHASDSDLVLEVVPDYPDLLAHAADASVLLDQVKQDNYDDRDAYYEQAEPHHNRLGELAKKLRVCDTFVTKKVNRRRKEEAEERAEKLRLKRRFQCQMLIGLLSVLLTTAWIVYRIT